MMLIGFLGAFFGLEYIINILEQFGISTANDYIVLTAIGNIQISVSIAALRVFLAAGAVFFEFVIIIQAMSDRIFDTLKALIRPLIMIIPISVFFSAVYKTFEPVIRSLLPLEFGGTNPNYIATAADNGILVRNVLITFGAMLLYILFNTILGGGTSAEVKTLQAELKRCRDRLRRG